MQPLRVTATLGSPYAVPLFPLNLDALLAAMVCERRGLIAGVGALQDVEIPVARSDCGRFHLASVGHHDPAPAVGGHTHKRSPVPEMMWFGAPKIRRINTATGPNKAFRIPQPRALVRTMHWWCVGEAEPICVLLDLVTHLGKKRSVGHGRVTAWSVAPCETWPGFPVQRPDGTPMRNLPLDFPGLGPDTTIGWGPLTYPYYDQNRAIEVAQAPDVTWSGP